MKVTHEALRQVEEAFEAYRIEVMQTRMTSSTKATYLSHTEYFVRWLKDDFEPGKYARIRYRRF